MISEVIPVYPASHASDDEIYIRLDCEDPIVMIRELFSNRIISIQYWMPVLLAAEVSMGEVFEQPHVVAADGSVQSSTRCDIYACSGI